MTVVEDVVTELRTVLSLCHKIVPVFLYVYIYSCIGLVILMNNVFNYMYFKLIFIKNDYTSNVFFPLLLWYFQFCVTTVIFSLFNDLVMYGTKTCFLRLVTLLNENFSPQMVQFTVDTISRKGLKGRPNLTSQLLPPFWDCNLPWSLQFGSRELKDFSCVTVIRWNKVAWVQLQPKVKAGCGTLKAGCGTVPVLLSQCLCGLISASLSSSCARHAVRSLSPFR